MDLQPQSLAPVYWCTNDPECVASFSDELTWSLHETTTHNYLHSMHLCNEPSLDNPELSCFTGYVELDVYMAHLRLEHGIDTEGYRHETRAIGPQSYFQFYCGFCQSLFPITCNKGRHDDDSGYFAWYDQRQEHIAAHFTGESDSSRREYVMAEWVWIPLVLEFPLRPRQPANSRNIYIR